MKRFFLTLLVLGILSAVAATQETEPDIYLASFEKCNNWARRYCLTGNHDAAVNRKLLHLKKKGYIITANLIKTYARKISPSISAR